MPRRGCRPANSHKTLKVNEKELLKRWIAAGAKYQNHWAFEPAVVKARPSGNPIDAFITDRLRREGLTLSPETDRPTLIRRVAFALTGLPPTVAEVDRFVSDKAADAYEQMVDRYLGSKHYGEEMARHWLDLARYADTHGLHLDNERQMYLYRDWVVRAFNDNMPFDRFTIEQVAGDLLPKATSEQVIATGFNRCNVSTSEGGSIDSEWIFRNAVDRTSTVVRVFAGVDRRLRGVPRSQVRSDQCQGILLDVRILPFRRRPRDGRQRPVDGAGDEDADADAGKEDRGASGAGSASFRAELVQKNQLVKYTDPADEAERQDARRSGEIVQEPGSEQAGKNVKGLPKEIVALLKQTKTEPANEKKLREYYVEFVCADTRPMFDALAKQVTTLTKERDGLNRAITGTFVFKELPQPRLSTVMMRGQYDKPGERVEPNTPSFLPRLVKADPKARATRLDLAKWLVAPEHPLTARVAVNRYWQQFFGTGLVKSSADFGTQGELPSHPELLDYLAAEFSSPLPTGGEGSG